MSFVPKMERVMNGSELRSITLGHPLVDSYLEFVGARGAVNTWLATAYDLKVFFEVVGGKDPSEVSAADVFAFLGQQRNAARGEGGADRGRRGWVVGADDRPAAVERRWSVRVSDRARRRRR